MLGAHVLVTDHNDVPTKNRDLTSHHGYYFSLNLVAEEFAIGSPGLY